MGKAQRVPVTMRALLQRINRKLAPEGERLKAARGGRWRSTTGDFYLLDFTHNFIRRPHINPEALGRKLGVLQPWEEVAAAER